ncbi:hypothetical protein [Agreia sp. COWG]|uniref:hypothetical protein n=1 Tax=Agreia sp. COWG TaxID=2773266 RepID=UPI001927CD00|nr:hypothetical protein [Agreia sp. COWG]
MSLMHTLARYGRVRRQPLDRRFWPSTAVATLDDLTVVGESMSAMARAVGTPCTRVLEAVAGAHAAQSDPAKPDAARPDTEAAGAVPGRRFCAVVVASVELVVPTNDGASAEVWLDAELDGCEPIGASMRLIGRSSGDDCREFGVRPSPRVGEVHAQLPIDIRPGDLLAFIIRNPVALYDIRRRSRHWERLL